jgi:aryl-alcohol dehydrogenase-like predicted oxidoreductase
MEYRPLGSTGIRVSAVAFGAGPVPALMVGDAQAAVVRRALEVGW